MEYCIFTGRQWSGPEMSREHIIPESIGGSLDFAIPVNRKANSDLGSAVDAPFMSNAIVGTLRWIHRVKNKAGKPASFVSEFVRVDGRDLADIRLDVREGVPTFQPKVPVEPVGSDAYLVWVTDPDQAEKKREEIERARPGLHLQAIDQEERVFDLRKTTYEGKVNGEVLLKFFAKMVLGGSYKFIGPDFATTAFADALRRVMYRGNEARDGVNFDLWAAHPDPRFRFEHRKCFPTHHCFALERDASGITAWVSVFSYFAARFRISDLDLLSRWPDPRGVLVLSDWATRHAGMVMLSDVEDRLGAQIGAIIAAPEAEGS